MPADQPRRPAFPTTRISLIQAAQGESGPHAHEALSTLCTAYWYPIYAYVRRLGHSHDEAEDLTQGFFTRVLEKRYLRDFDRERGRFRSFLLGALKHFIANERDAAHAKKRGGGRALLSLDECLQADQRYGVEAPSDLTPDRVFERQWALTVLTRAQHRLGDEAMRQGKAGPVRPAERPARRRGHRPWLSDARRGAEHHRGRAQSRRTSAAAAVSRAPSRRDREHGDRPARRGQRASGSARRDAHVTFIRHRFSRKWTGVRDERRERHATLRPMRH